MYYNASIRLFAHFFLFISSPKVRPRQTNTKVDHVNENTSTIFNNINYFIYVIKCDGRREENRFKCLQG